MKKRTQIGFAAVELVIVVVLLAAIAGTGYYVLRNRSKSTPTTASNTSASTSQTSSAATPTAPQINSASDLNSAMQALNQTSVTAGSTDSSQLTTQSSGF